jgi:hypothetical protein
VLRLLQVAEFLPRVGGDQFLEEQRDQGAKLADVRNLDADEDCLRCLPKVARSKSLSSVAAAMVSLSHRDMATWALSRTPAAASSPVRASQPSTTSMAAAGAWAPILLSPARFHNLKGPFEGM